MKRFAALYDAIDRTTSTNAKVAAMVQYFQTAPRSRRGVGGVLPDRPPAQTARSFRPQSGRGHSRPRDSTSGCSTSAMRSSATAPRRPRSCSIRWRSRPTDDAPLSAWVQDRILPLRELDPAAQQALVGSWWSRLDRLQRFMLLKILTGELRVGVSQTLVVRALAQAAGLPPTTIAARLMGEWAPARRGSRPSSRTSTPTTTGRGPIRSSSHRRSRSRSRRLARVTRLDRRMEMGRHSRTARAPG